MPASRERIQSIDALRGLCVLLMIAYHFGYDLVLVGLLPQWVLFNPLLNALEPFFAGIFILLCGVSCRFSHSNLRRGALLAGVALLLTAATWCLEHLFSMGAVTVWFGILHFLSVAILIYWALRKAISRIPDRVQPFLFGGLFLACYCLFPLQVSFPGLSFLGLLGPDFQSADFFPLLPWLPLFLFGTWLGGPVRDRKLPAKFYTLQVPFFPAVGRHALPVYILHQPVLMGISMLLQTLFVR